MPEPYQKVVRVSWDGKLMASGGDDGILRVWTFPELNPVHEIEAHEKEIDDIEFSPDNTKAVSISKDRRAIVWDIRRGKKHAEMGWDPPGKLKYLYKRVRFGRIEGDSRKFKVFTIANPVGASKPPSYIQRWDPKSFTIEQAVGVAGSLSALAVSDNGIFVATGSMFDGTVEIYTSFNLAVTIFYHLKFLVVVVLLSFLVIDNLFYRKSRGLKKVIQHLLLDWNFYQLVRKLMP
jgi:prolactin regulatory element-binding protein